MLYQNSNSPQEQPLEPDEYPDGDDDWGPENTDDLGFNRQQEQ